MEAPDPSNLPLRKIEEAIRQNHPQALDGIPRNKRAEIIKGTMEAVLGGQIAQHQQITIQESYTGAIPHPEHLKAFDQIVPGAAKMIFDEFQNQSSHRRGLESRVIESQLGQSAKGQWIGAVLAILFVGVGTFLSLKGCETAGSVLMGSTLVGVVAVFVVGKNKQSQSFNPKRR